MASTLTKVNDKTVIAQLANLSDKDVTLKAGTRLCDGHYLDNETIRIVNETADAAAGNTNLPDLTLNDIKCDDETVHKQVLDLANNYRKETLVGCRVRN